jgi:Uma2 family endonuclease
MLGHMADEDRRPPKRRATYQDVIDAPEHMVAEILDGELFLSPRPAAPHAVATTVLGSQLTQPFYLGRGGPGGWIIMFESELHVGEDVVVPDLAGWKRERMPRVPDRPFLDLAPDWVCETLSPSTLRIDRRKKLRIYAREGVSYVWLLGPIERHLEIYRLQSDSGQLALVNVHGDDEVVRAEPFEAIELELAPLWTVPDVPATNGSEKAKARSSGDSQTARSADRKSRSTSGTRTPVPGRSRKSSPRR